MLKTEDLLTKGAWDLRFMAACLPCSQTVLPDDPGRGRSADRGRPIKWLSFPPNRGPLDA